MVLSDGPRVFLEEAIDGRYLVVQASSTGGDTVPIPTNFENVALDNISPDKSELMVGSFTGEEMEKTLLAMGATFASITVPARTAVYRL